MPIHINGFEVVKAERPPRRRPWSNTPNPLYTAVKQTLRDPSLVVRVELNGQPKAEVLGRLRQRMHRHGLLRQRVTDDAKVVLVWLEPRPKGDQP